jgi:hypothetical protein
MKLSQDMAQALVDMARAEVIKRLLGVRNEIDRTIYRNEVNGLRYRTLVGLQADLLKVLETLK